MGEQQGQNVMRRKLVIIGDGACGKTSLLSVFTLGYFPTVRPFQAFQAARRMLTMSSIMYLRSSRITLQIAELMANLSN